MRIEIATPTSTAIIDRGIQVRVAPSGTSWSELSLGAVRSEVGVYIIHHAGEIKYDGKTSGRTMNFGIRLRRHFQEKAAGKRTYPKLADIKIPPEIQVCVANC